MRLALLLLPFLAAASVSNKNPGLKFELVTSSIRYLTNIAVSELEQNLKKVVIPDVEQNSGFLKYHIKSIGLTSFTVNQDDVEVTPIPGTGFRIETKNANMGLFGDYAIDIGPAMHETGKVAISMSKFAISVDVGLGMYLGKDNRGRLAVTTSDCRASVSSVAIKFSGSAFSGFVNLFRWIIDLSLRPKMQELVCGQITHDIDIRLDGKLKELSMNIPLGDSGIVVDASLTRSPVVLTSTFNVELSGASWFEGATQPSYEPAVLPACPVQDRMFHATIAQDFVNSLFNAVYLTGRLQTVVDKAMVEKSSPDNAHYLNISCTDFLCLGAMLPTVNEKFGGGSLWVNVSAASAPNLTFTEDNTVVLNLDLNLDLRAEFDNGSIIPIFDINLLFGIIAQNMSLTNINSTLYSLRVDNFDCTQPHTVLNSINVDGVTPDGLEGLFQFAIPFGIGKIQPAIENGIQIGGNEIVELQNVLLTSLNNAFFIATDAYFFEESRSIKI